VLPPPDLDYPDFERDGPAFYDKIGSYKLKRIYCKDLDAADEDLTRIKTLGGLVERVMDKKKATERVVGVVLDSITWKVWERFPRDMGKWDTDPWIEDQKARRTMVDPTV